MDELEFEIPRRINKLDAVIIVSVGLMVGIDLVLIRDPLHTLLGMLMLPAAIRVIRGFHFVQIGVEDGRRVLRVGRLGSEQQFDLSESPLTVEPATTVFGGQRLRLVPQGAAVTVGHTATRDELNTLSILLTTS